NYDVYDKTGTCLCFGNMVDGEAMEYLQNDPRFWRYTTEYVKHWVKYCRNHPSIIVWSAENEVDLINNMGNNEVCKRRELEMFKAVRELDPSRPVMGDGAGALLNENEVCNW